MKIIFPVLVALGAMVLTLPADAARIKDLAKVQGVRSNQLIGYGLVVGLPGTGEKNNAFTEQTFRTMLNNFGIKVPDNIKPKIKDVAPVAIHADLPPFSKPGQTIDVTVSAIGEAKSLRGGTLLMTQMKGADGQVYAMAQGNVVVGGAGASSGGSKVTVNHLSAGRIPAGATVERAVPTALGQGGMVYYELANTDFGTAQKVVDAINQITQPGTAQAIDGRRIAVRVPEDSDARVAFLGRIDNLEIQPVVGLARVIVNSRTGSVVMNQKVALDACAVAHGNLSVVVDAPQPQFGQGADIQVKQDNGSLMNVKAGASLAEVVKALNALGANPMDLLAILQAMKAAGALRAELEVI